MIDLDPRLLAQFVDLLMKAVAGLFQKNTIRSDCKKAGEKISAAIREILSLEPDIARVRALLTEAEKLCPGEAVQVARARELLAALEGAGVRRTALRSRKAGGASEASKAKKDVRVQKPKKAASSVKSTKR